MRFEIMRLSETDGSATDRRVVDAAGVREAVDEAASNGDRIYIRPLAVQALKAVA
ncbi:hypothetical protein [Phaeacidiphilus oryzae]|jgi:hypothetical protein|uniref:hypothetical protein n=1 Tax=Phaeacidiphilus oryzae TaxID=348818 RepID=UPI00190F3361|nr:hypothetical protein [Phaeacidiphilus oryzae]